MSKLFFCRGRGVPAWAVLALWAVSGCGLTGGSADGNRPRPTLSLSTLGVDSASTFYEDGANNGISSAEDVFLTADPRVIRGEIGGSNDVDVYNLGPAIAGDRIIVDVAASGSLDAAIALFDGSGDSLLVNDHRNVYRGQRLPFIDVVIRESTDACYVGIATTPGFESSGEYALQAQRLLFSSIPEPNGDEILLVFTSSTNVHIGSRGPINVPAFDPADFDTRFSGDAAEMIAEIVDDVRRDFAGLDVTIYSTSEGTVYASGMSRVFFGTFDPALLGVAEGVDEFNSASSQEAIIFTDTFAAFNELRPSVEEMGQAIANVASHEIGHLLGLIHTTDKIGIMDVTGSLRDLLGDQTFRRSPIYAAVFPIGAQDAVQSLMASVGGDPLMQFMKYVTYDGPTIESDQPSSEPSARSQLLLSSCGLDHH